jgi:hypothetical protein
MVAVRTFTGSLFGSVQLPPSEHLGGIEVTAAHGYRGPARRRLLDDTRPVFDRMWRPSPVRWPSVSVVTISLAKILPSAQWGHL